MKTQYQLICSYVKNKYFVSTIYRMSSTIEPMWYFETIAWEWDSITKQRGNSILDMADSGICEADALKGHIAMCEKLIKQ